MAGKKAKTDEEKLAAAGAALTEDDDDIPTLLRLGADTEQRPTGRLVATSTLYGERDGKPFTIRAGVAFRPEECSKADLAAWAKQRAIKPEMGDAEG